MKPEYELCISFIIGGVVVALITYVTKYTNTKLSAIIWAFPTLLVASMFSMWYMNVKNEEINDFLLKCIPINILTAIWILICAYCMKTCGFVNSIAYSCVIWVFIALAWYKYLL